MSFLRKIFKQDPEPIPGADEFEFLTSSGLEALINIVGVDSHDYMHMGQLKFTWQNYLSIVKKRLPGFTKAQPYYQAFLEAVKSDAVYSELNKGEPAPYTEAEVRKLFEDEFQEFYDQAPLTYEPPRRIIIDEWGYEEDQAKYIDKPARRFKDPVKSRNWATEKLLTLKNEGRTGLRKDEFLRNPQGILQSRSPEIWERLYQEYVAHNVPSLEQFSLSTLLNLFGDIIPDYGAINLAEPPYLLSVRDIRGVNTTYGKGIRDRIETRFKRVLNAARSIDAPAINAGYEQSYIDEKSVDLFYVQMSHAPINIRKILDREETKSSRKRKRR